MDFLTRDTVTQVNEYRVFTMGHDGHIKASRAFVCESDDDATVWAKQLVDGHDVELWCGERFVIRVEHRENGETGRIVAGQSRDAG